MTTDAPELPDRDSERVSVSPPGARARFTVSATFLALIAVGLVYRGISEPYVMDYLAREPVVAVVLAAVLVVAVWAAKIWVWVMFGFLPGLEQIGRSIAIDANGIWYIQKRQRVLLPWRDVAGVGFAVDRESRFRFTIEIYLHDVAAYADDKLVNQWFVDESVSHSGMPRKRLRFPPIRIDPIRDILIRDVRRVARRTWVGGRPYGSSERMVDP